MMHEKKIKYEVKVMVLLIDFGFVFINIFFSFYFGIIEKAPTVGLIIYTVLTGLMIIREWISIYWLITIIFIWTYYLFKNEICNVDSTQNDA